MGYKVAHGQLIRKQNRKKTYLVRVCDLKLEKPVVGVGVGTSWSGAVIAVKGFLRSRVFFPSFDFRLECNSSLHFPKLKFCAKNFDTAELDKH